MKKISSTRGVTLLEIMLVLAIAAMIIVMSVRYYQSANSSQQANQTLQQIQSITAAADSLASGTGSYSTVTSVAITPLLPSGGLSTAWGSTITVAPVAGGTSYTVSIPSTPAYVCTILKSKLALDKHFTSTSTCDPTKSGAFSYTYSSIIS